MKNKLIFLLVLFFTALFMFGCTGTSSTICGDNICSTGEELSCPTDCAVKVNGDVIININGAYDSDGEISLYWYHSKDVYANISQGITSRLGDNWYGSTNKNLNISFNDSSSGSIPVEKYGNRQIVLSNLEQGDYYFEARTEDYQYRAVSEKILVKEDGDRYITLNLVPSYPAVRIRAVDEDYNPLNGEGTIEIHYVEETWNNGEYETYEGLYNSMSFENGEEMNALFYVWQPEILDNRNVYYKAVVKKEGYTSEVRNIWGTRYNKYSEYSVVSTENEPIVETGNLEINIVAGNEKSDYSSQMFLLEGKEVQICKASNWSCESVILDSDLKINLENKAYGDYAIQLGLSGFNLNEIPYTINDTVTIDSENSVTEVKARRGSLTKISVLDANRQIIDSSKIKIHSVCSNNGASISCYDHNGVTWDKIAGSNPLAMTNQLYSENDLNLLLAMEYIFKLEFNEQIKEFNFPIFRQGYNTQRLGFDSSQTIDRNYSIGLDVGKSIFVQGGSQVNGKIVQIKLVDILRLGIDEDYLAKLELIDSLGRVVKTIETNSGVSLKGPSKFGSSFLETPVGLESINYTESTGIGYISLRVE